MITKSFCLKVKTKHAPEFIDITDWVTSCVAESEVNNGLCRCVFQTHHGGG